MNAYIYLRALKHAEHTVFCVEKGQKTYFDQQFNRFVAYSSGQQVKRSILDALDIKFECSDGTHHIQLQCYQG
jgi:hypothetical protein